jgi:hypothetical protein
LGRSLLKVAKKIEDAMRLFWRTETACINTLEMEVTAVEHPITLSSNSFIQHSSASILERVSSNSSEYVLENKRSVCCTTSFHQDTVLVYQTGFNYSLIESANKEAPGLLTHVLAADYNVSQGHARYDLLAGDSEYKQALANKCELLWWGRIQRRRLKFRAEDSARCLWKRIHIPPGLT